MERRFGSSFGGGVAFAPDWSRMRRERQVAPRGSESDEWSGRSFVDDIGGGPKNAGRGEPVPGYLGAWERRCFSASCFS